MFLLEKKHIKNVLSVIQFTQLTLKALNTY